MTSWSFWLNVKIAALGGLESTYMKKINWTFLDKITKCPYYLVDNSIPIIEVPLKLTGDDMLFLIPQI